MKACVNLLFLQARSCTRVMSLAVRLDTGEEMDGVEVGENVLDGWKSVGEGFFDGLVDCMGVVERCEEGAREHVDDGV